MEGRGHSVRESLVLQTLGDGGKGSKAAQAPQPAEKLVWETSEDETEG